MVNNQNTNPNPTSKRYARRQIVRNDRGYPSVQFVDTMTGQVIPPNMLGGYVVLGQGQNHPLFGGTTPEAEETPETEEQTSEDPNRLRFQQGHSPGEGLGFSGRQGRDPSNNFGYIDKPGFMSIMGALPGMPGLMGKAVNAAVNANNVAAVNAARGMMGIGPLSEMESLRGVAFDRDGYVADVVIGDETYTVGLEGMTKDGRTTLTPNEARTRGMLNGIREATPQEVQANQRAGSTQEQGLLSRALGGVRDAFGNMFGSRQTQTTQAPAARSVSTSVAPVSRGFTQAPTAAPTAPAAPAAATRGRGLQDVADVTAPGRAQVNQNYGPQTVGPAQSDLSAAVATAVANTFGPGYSVNETSGARTNSGNHMGGRAVDFNVTDPEGNRVTDQAAMEALGAELGRQGVQSLGYGAGYMGPGMMHAGMDISTGGARSWGALGLSRNANPAVAEAFQSELSPTGILGFNIDAAPSGRPTGALARTAEDQSMRSLQDMTRDNIADIQATTQQVAQDVTSRAQDRGRVSPETVGMISHAIAGELGSQTLGAIARGDVEAMDVARSEIAAIAETMANRAESSRFAGKENPYAEAITPATYNSLMSSNLATTDDNFSKFGDFITQAVEDWNEGILSSPVPGATHYHAEQINPGWAKYALDTPVQVGQHVFSTVAIPGTQQPEFSKAAPTAGFAPGWSGPSNSVSTSSISPGIGDGYSGSSNIGAGSSSGYGGFEGRGSGYGQSSAGVSSGNTRGGIDTSGSWGGSDGRSSFGGFSAGSLDGSGSGFGSGLGSLGSDAGRGGGFSPGGGDYSGGGYSPGGEGPGSRGGSSGRGSSGSGSGSSGGYGPGGEGPGSRGGGGSSSGGRGGSGSGSSGSGNSGSGASGRGGGDASGHTPGSDSGGFI